MCFLSPLPFYLHYLVLVDLHHLAYHLKILINNRQIQHKSRLSKDWKGCILRK